MKALSGKLPIPLLMVLAILGCSTADKQESPTDDDSAPVHTLGPEGFVRNWLIAGPFPNPETAAPLPDGSSYLAYYEDYLQTLGGESGAVISAGESVPYRTKDGAELQARTMQVHAGENGIVDIRKLFEETDYKAVYAFCYIRSGKARSVDCLFGSNDDAKVWINGRLVHQVAAGRSCTPGQDSFSAELKEGLNPVLIKVCNRWGGWAFVLEAYSAEARARMAERPLAKALREIRECQICMKDGTGWDFSLEQGAFPEIGWKNPYRVEKLLGDFSLSVRWFGAGMKEVTAPAGPGQYVAMVEGISPDGVRIERAVTFYCRPKGWQPAAESSSAEPPVAGGSGDTGTAWEPGTGPASSSDVKTLLALLGERSQNAVSVSYQAGKQYRGVARAGGQPGTHPRFFERTVSKIESVSYWLYLPDDYGKTNRRWPMVLFLHGSGEKGRDLEKLNPPIPPENGDIKKDFPFLVLSPQCPETYDGWSSELLAGLLDEVISSYEVDIERIYLTGVSMGGRGTWSLACEYPERFAAVAPLAGNYSHPEKAIKLVSLPVWAFHGKQDNLVPLAGVESMVNGIKANGGDARLTVFPDAGHSIAGITYNNKELYSWFLEHRKGKKAPGGN